MPLVTFTVAMPLPALKQFTLVGAVVMLNAVPVVTTTDAVPEQPVLSLAVTR